MARGCSCNHGPDGTPCFKLFTETQLRELRDECRELSHEELSVVMGELRALTLHTGQTWRTTERVRTVSKFQFGGRPVCIKIFCFLHGISRWKFNEIKASWPENGLRPRRRKRTTPHNVTRLVDIQLSSTLRTMPFFSLAEFLDTRGMTSSFSPSTTKRKCGSSTALHLLRKKAHSVCYFFSAACGDSLLLKLWSPSRCQICAGFARKQHIDHAISQPPCRGEDRGKNVCIRRFTTFIHYTHCNTLLYTLHTTHIQCTHIQTPFITHTYTLHILHT